MSGPVTFWFQPQWHVANLLTELALLTTFIAVGVARVRAGKNVLGRVNLGVLGLTLVLNLLALVASVDVASTELARDEVDTREGVATQRGEEFDPALDLAYDSSAVLDTWWRGSHIQNVWVYDLLLLVAGLVLAGARREYWRNAWRQVSVRPIAMTCFGVMSLYAVIAILDSLTWRDQVHDPSTGEPRVVRAPAPLTSSQISADVTGNRQRVQEFKQQWVGLPDLDKDRRSLLTRLCLQLGIYREPDDRERTYSAPLANRLYKRLPQTLAVQRQTGEPDPTRRDLQRTLDAAGFAALRSASDQLSQQGAESILAQDDSAEITHGIAITVLVGGLDRRITVDCGDTLPDSIAALRGRVARAVSATAGPGEPPLRADATITLQDVRVDTAGRVQFQKLLHPGSHLLGTNESGQDVLYLSLRGIRTALIIGCVTTLIAIPFAMLFGVLAGYFGGWVDDVITWIYAVLGNIPDVLLIAAVILLFGPGLFQLCIVMGLTSWVGLCRLLRGEALRLREMEYVQAARAFGVAEWRIIMRHIVPNVMHIVLISFILRFSNLVLVEAVLSYLGIGVGPETGSWGNMINQAIGELAREPVVWWSFASAMMFMLVLVLAANLFGDAVRDALDPRLRTR